MPDKPFIAARIPEELNHALNQHVERSGESRTETLISALEQYLNLTPSNKPQSKSATKIGSLEGRIARLEEMILGKPESHSVIETDNKIDNASEDAYMLEICIEPNNADNTIDSSSIGNIQNSENNVIEFDNIVKDMEKDKGTEAQPSLFPTQPRRPGDPMSTKEIAQATGLSPEGAKSRHHQGKSITYSGIEYIAKKNGRSTVWIPKTDDNTDNSETVPF
jgi:hypothetical protein